MSKLFSRVIVFAALFMCLGESVMQAQAGYKKVGRKYANTDVSSVYRDQVMLLFTDNTYINFGIVNDFANLNVYVWYSSGRFTLTGSTLSCSSEKQALSNAEMIALVKNEYSGHPAFRLIESFCDYINQPYTNYHFVFTGNVMIDKQKGIEYVRLHNVN